MPIYDLYGLRARDLEEARRQVENKLGLVLEPRKSGYHCGEYYGLGFSGSQHFILQRNFDEMENEWTESAHLDWSLLLYVNETTEADDIQSRLAGVASLLRRERV